MQLQKERKVKKMIKNIVHRTGVLFTLYNIKFHFSLVILLSLVAEPGVRALSSTPSRESKLHSTVRGFLVRVS